MSNAGMQYKTVDYAGIPCTHNPQSVSDARVDAYADCGLRVRGFPALI